MKNKKNRNNPITVLILVMTLVFAVTFTGCDTGSGVGNGGGGTGGGGTGGGAAGVTDPALNGVWGDWWAGQFVPWIWFNNGNVEIFSEVPHDGSPFLRGTFTTSDNYLTMRFTHMHGGVFFEDAHLGFGSRWYTLTDVRARAQTAGDWELVGELDSFFIPPAAMRYFVSGNTLTLIGELVGGLGTFHRM